jgi:capsular polysaccharide biosynthesis protein
MGTLSPEAVRERLWAYEDFTMAAEQQPFNVAGSFASLGFIGAALRRSRRFWLACAVAGMVAGLAIYVKYPVSYQAKVTVLVKNNPGDDPVSAMQTQLQLVQSESVAASTVKALGLTQTVSSFKAAYSAAVVTDQVISITVQAPTADGAVARANTLAAQYLEFRARLLLAQEAQDAVAYAQQVPAAQQRIATLKSQISQLRGQPGQQAKLAGLQSQLTTATTTLPSLEQTVTGLTAVEKATTSGMIDGSQVLDAATLQHHSTLKDLIEYLLIGLIGGLAIGLGIVVVRDLVSDRLRRRDDIAAALGAPVRLSVGALRKRRLPFGGRSDAERDIALRRIVVYLRNAAALQSAKPATLALVAVDNSREIGPAVVALAGRCAQEDQTVVVADLLQGAPVARLLGVEGTGAQAARIGGKSLVVITPEEPGQVMSGPLRPAGAAGAGLLAEPAANHLDALAKQATIVLTVAELDPAIGGEYLSTWATQAVAVFTAGRTRAVRAYAVGEMLRLSGIRAVSGVIVGADKTDESLGSAPGDASLAGFRPAGAEAPEALEVPETPGAPEASCDGSGADPAPEGGKPGVWLR